MNNILIITRHDPSEIVEVLLHKFKGCNIETREINIDVNDKEQIAFMDSFDAIAINAPVSIQSVLLEKLKHARILRYVFDRIEVDTDTGFKSQGKNYKFVLKKIKLIEDIKIIESTIWED